MPGTGPIPPHKILDAIRNGAQFEHIEQEPGLGVLIVAGEIQYLTATPEDGWTLTPRGCRMTKETFDALAAVAHERVSLLPAHAPGYLTLGGWSHALVPRTVDGVPVAELAVAGPSLAVSS